MEKFVIVQLVKKVIENGEVSGVEGGDGCSTVEKGW
jgi:hypothetical protein